MTNLQAECPHCKHENDYVFHYGIPLGVTILTCGKCREKFETFTKPRGEIEQCSHPSYAMEKHGSTEMCRKCGKTWG